MKTSYDINSHVNLYNSKLNAIKIKKKVAKRQ